MIKDLAQKATVEQTHALGNTLTLKGMSPEEVLLFLKDRHYIINGVKYQGAYVANYVAGAYSIINSVKAGTSTCTKAKGWVIK